MLWNGCITWWRRRRQQQQQDVASSRWKYNKCNVLDVTISKITARWNGRATQISSHGGLSSPGTTTKITKTIHTPQWFVQEWLKSLAICTRHWSWWRNHHGACWHAHWLCRHLHALPPTMWQLDATKPWLNYHEIGFSTPRNELQTIFLVPLRD